MKTQSWSLLKIVLLCSFLNSIIARAYSQSILVAWDFNGNAGDEETVVAEIFAPNISTIDPSGVIGRGQGIAASRNAGRFNANRWITNNNDHSTLSYAVSNDKYIEWSIASTTGYLLSIDSIVFNWQRSGTGPNSLALRSNQDDFSSDLDTKTELNNSNSTLISVLGGFSNLDETVTFRLYGFGANGRTGSGGLEGSDLDLIVYGNVVEDQSTLFAESFDFCPAEGWLNVRIAGEQDWRCDEVHGNATVGGLEGNGSNEAWLVSPPIDFSQMLNEKLTFSTWTGSSDKHESSLRIFYSTNYLGFGNPNVATWNELLYNIPAKNLESWTPSGGVDVSIIPDGQAYLGFKYTSFVADDDAINEWRIDEIVISEETCQNPTTQANSLNFTNVAVDKMTVNWMKGDGVGRLIVASLSPVTFIPVDGTEYIASADFREGAELGIGNKVVYAGGGDSFDLTGLTSNTTYYFAIFEFNCGGSNRLYLEPPQVGSFTTLDANGSDIIADASFDYPAHIPYIDYTASSSAMNYVNSIPIFGMTLRDGGPFAHVDGLATILTSISFSTNGSTAIRAAAIDAGNGLIGNTDVDGATEFSLDLSDGSVLASDGSTTSFQLYVTFTEGDLMTDQEQIVLSVAEIDADTAGTSFITNIINGVESSNADYANTIDVIANRIQVIQQPSNNIYVNEDFLIEAAAVDALGTRDKDMNLEVSVNTGSGILTSEQGLTQRTVSGSARWENLHYNMEEAEVQFAVKDVDGNVSEDLTNLLVSKSRLCTFTFTGASGNESNFGTDIQSFHVTVSAISRGPGINPSKLENSFSANSWPNPPETDFDPDSYFEISMAADIGFSFDINKIEFDHRRSGTGPLNWEIRNSTDNFDASQGGNVLGSGSWNRNEVVNYSISDQNSVTLRIYAYNASSNAGTWAVDNVVVFGDVRDSQAPEFLSGYPLVDSARIDGFHLQARVDEPVTAFYLVKRYGDPAPTDPGDIVIGIGGVQNGSFAVNRSASEIVKGLSTATPYDIYWVLDDGAHPLVINAIQTYVRTSDNSARVGAPESQNAATTIPGTVNSSSEAVDIFSFQIQDNGKAVGDKAPTTVSKIWIKNPVDTTDWAKMLGGATLTGNRLGDIPLEDVRILSDSIVMLIDPGDLTIPDQYSETITMAVYTLSSSIKDGMALQFEISQSDPRLEFNTSEYGTQFSDPFVETPILSNVHHIDVRADSILFNVVPDSIHSDNDIFTVSIQAVDENGNPDIDKSAIISLSLGIGAGTLSSNSSLTKEMVNGIATWDDLTIDGPNESGESFTLIASDWEGLLQQTSSPVIIFNNAGDLLVTEGNTVTITGDRSYQNVTIEDNASLNLANGARLRIAGDLSVNGANSNFIDQGGTTYFDGSEPQLIQSDQDGKTISFFNIEIGNTQNDGVTNELNINLLNTLKLNADSKFDANGTDTNNYDFTLVSTPTSTARIGTLENGAILTGNVVWERSLSNGPEGWRYVGTPIKNQLVANWRDDVHIRGYEESQPNDSSNFAFYSEPFGTNGQSGSDGWIYYAADEDTVQVGVGNKLFVRNSDLNPTLNIINKGLPFVGDGFDSEVIEDEVYSFPVSHTPTSFDGGGWNLLANPYPCELDWNSEDFIHSKIEGNAFYIWNPTLQQYAIYNGSESINGADQYIASGQAFFIKAIDETAVVSITERAKSTAGVDSFLRKAKVDYQRLKVRIQSEENHSDEAIIVFRPDALDSYEPDLDVRKLYVDGINITSIVDQNHFLAINSMESLGGVKYVKLNLVTDFFGPYALQVPQIENFDDGTVIQLIDKYLNKTITIDSKISYRFSTIDSVEASYGSDRFELRFLCPINLWMENCSVKASEDVVVPVYANQLKDISTMEIGLSWDPESLSFVDVDNMLLGDSANLNLQKISFGQLQYSFRSDEELHLPDSAKLFDIRFTALYGIPATNIIFKNDTTFMLANDIEMPVKTSGASIDIFENRLISGKVVTPAGDPISGVTVRVRGEEDVELVTGNGGDYSVSSNEQSSYIISATSDLNQEFNIGISTLDIILARRHLLNLGQLSNPYQIIAADINISKSISALDIAQMRQLVLGFDFVNEIEHDLLFIPSTCDLSETPFDYELESNVEVTDEHQSIDFVAIKLGDVNGSWAPLGAERLSSSKAIFNFGTCVLSRDTLSLPIYVHEFNKVSGFQFSIQWDPRVFEYSGLENEIVEGFFNEEKVQEGILTVIWDEPSGRSITLQDGMVAFKLKLKAKDLEASSFVLLNSSLTEALVVDEDLNTISIKDQTKAVDFSEIDKALELFQNSPNPFDQRTNLKFKIAKSGKVRLSISNVFGEQVYGHEQIYDPGLHYHTWELNNSSGRVAPGVYIIILENGDQRRIRKMMIK